MNEVVQVYEGDGVNPKWVGYKFGDGCGSSGCQSGSFLGGTGVGDGGQESSNIVHQAEQENGSGVETFIVNGDDGDGYGANGNGGAGTNSMLPDPSWQKDEFWPVCNNAGDQDLDS